ncbi:MAG TPA: hypothetical protein VLJ10_03385 [Candidatus Bathyarchaeia archaeon]|nr:hypothetical protein [Candidatus Bathyarchaeia archaeon]
MKTLILFMISVLLTTSVYAQETFGNRRQTQEQFDGIRLGARERERIRAMKDIVRGVDGKTLEQTIRDIENADDPQLELQIKEAIAKTYADIVLQEKVVDQKQKEWLYSMITINMAYLQFGGSGDDSGNGLHRLIRNKLRDYLPPEVWTRPGFLQTIE